MAIYRSPVLEGQPICILVPGLYANDWPYHVGQYSMVSPRNGDRFGYNNSSLTIKRILEDQQGQPVRGVG